MKFSTESWKQTPYNPCLIFFAGVQSASQVSIPDVNVEPNPANVSSETNINCTWKEDFELLSANISMWVEPDYESAYMATDSNSLANIK